MPTIVSTPARLAVRLCFYFVVVFGVTALMLSVWPEATLYLPFGGHDALDSFGAENVSDFVTQFSGGEKVAAAAPLSTGHDIVAAAIFLTLHLSGTILLMIPLTWTYMAAKQDTGYHQSFVHALIVLPICAATIVLLIQDSLALAFGLAALVAAVRFRVALAEAIDGIFIFAAICVGLSAGVGYLGIAAVMTVFFCFASLILWQLDYGTNPVEEAQRERKREKTDRKDGQRKSGLMR
jgi:hypothetical protein